MKFFLNNIELILSAAGLVVIILVPFVFFSGTSQVWEATAVTAVSVGILHGMIFWVVRNRQRKIRDEAIEEIKLMLKDVINNKLTVISLSSSGVEAQKFKSIFETVEQISSLVNSLSEESLTKWHGKYQKTLTSLDNLQK